MQLESVCYGSLYRVRIVGENYKNFRNTIVNSANNGGLAYDHLDTARVQTLQNFPVQHNPDHLRELIEDTTLPPFKGMVKKTEKYFDSSTNKTIRLYKIFFQYPLKEQSVTSEANLKFALQVDVLVRCLRMQMLNSFAAEIISVKVDETTTLGYNDFVVKMTEEFATEDEESSGRHSSKYELRSVSSTSTISTKTLLTKLEKARIKVRDAKRENKELLNKMEKERNQLLNKIEKVRKEAEKEKNKLLDKMENERKELLDKMEKERKELLDKAEKERKELLDKAEKDRKELQQLLLQLSR